MSTETILVNTMEELDSEIRKRWGGKAITPRQWELLVADAKLVGITTADLRASAAKWDVKLPPNAKPKPRASVLADDVMNPKHRYAPGALGLIAHEPIAQGIRRARRMVLDDAAVELVVNMAAEMPKAMNLMRKASRPVEKTIWVEFNSRAMLMARRALVYRQAEKLGVSPYDCGWSEDMEHHATNRDSSARTGMLIDYDGENTFFSNCIEHTEGAEWMIWPLGFRIAIDGRPFQEKEFLDRGIMTGGGDKLVRVKDGKLDLEQQARMIWGYSQGVDIKPLVGTCSASTSKELLGLMNAGLVNEAVRELSGWSRMTVAVLSLLNSIGEMGEPVKPKGTRLIRNRPLPYLSMTPAHLVVPKRIRNREDYALREIRKTGIRHRLHEVRPHYRHLDHPPKTEGWEEVLIGGKTYWRKRIDAHLRGDPDIGVVEHQETIVHGR